MTVLLSTYLRTPCVKVDNVNTCLRQLASGMLITIRQASQPLTERSNGPQFPYPQNGDIGLVEKFVRELP